MGGREAYQNCTTDKEFDIFKSVGYEGKPIVRVYATAHNE